MPESAARRRSENAAAGRRKARRPASWAGDLWRSRDRPGREAGHGVRRFRTSACRRPAPLIFSEEAGKTTKGTRPCRSGLRSVGCLTIESEMNAMVRVTRAANSSSPLPLAGGGGERDQGVYARLRRGLSISKSTLSPPPSAATLSCKRERGSGESGGKRRESQISQLPFKSTISLYCHKSVMRDRAAIRREGG